ncbi:MAG: TonB-dependent receptor [Bacteroidales bacterium]|jgi:TonB-linked SusC/RagA family outer membrane protein|nr:TonB-dependent receptor [Bacteroidales bacterium]
MKIKFKHLFICVFALLGALIPTDAFAQVRTVSGVVYDAKTHEPVIGAGVMIKGTNNGFATNNDGTYTIKAKPKDVLVCQYFGYKTQEVVVGDRTKIDFAMESDTQTLEQSVVVGYGTLKKTQLVGAVENLSGKSIENRINPNVVRSLQGQISGLNIVEADGKPNHSGSIHIRGNATSYSTRSSMTSASGKSHSMGSGSGALVLIDGVEGSLSQVNPADIETVAVLKDAASAAVYGSKGAFGVILVTTKNPTGDKVSVNYNGSFSLNRRTVIWENGIESDGYTWAKSFANFFQNNDRTPTSSGTFPNAVNNVSGTFSQAYLTELGKRAAEGYVNRYGLDDAGNYVYYGNTNWLKLFYKPVSSSQTHNITINASSKRMSYSLSGRYYNQSGIYKVGNEDYHTYNFRSKGLIRLTKWMKLENNTSLFTDYYKQPFYAYNALQIKYLEHRGQPIFVPTNEDGTHTYWGEYTGYWRFKEGNDYQLEKSVNLQTTNTLTIEPIKDVLKFSADFTYKIRRYESDRVRTPSTYSGAPGVETEFIKQIDSYHSRWRNNTDTETADVVGTFTPKLGKDHELNIVAGWNLYNYDYTRWYAQRKGILWDSLPSYELMDGMDDSFDDYLTSYGTVGFFGRANYSYLKRYIFEVAARYDGSSKFPENQQWGFFPSVSFGWRLSEEPWMDWSDSWLDNFKVRANVGSLGNANISAYRFLETMKVDKSSMLFDGQKLQCANQATIIPDGLTWETVTTYDVGLDWDILKSRLSFSGDYYVRDIDNMIVDGPELPGVYGAAAPEGNYGSMQTKGWELTLSWKDQFALAGKPFTYNIKGSLWDSRTWVTEFNNTSGNILTYYNNKEIGEIWGFKTDGYFLSNAEANNWVIDTFHKNGNNFREYAGDLKFLDLDGDGKITTGSGTLDDHGDLARIGNTTPRYQYGITLNCSWNNIGVNVLLQGVGKRDWYPSVESGFFYGMYNRPYGFLLKSQEGNTVDMDYSTTNWTVTNADEHPYWTRQVAYSANRNVGPLTWSNDYYLQNAAYLRLKNLTVSYTMPDKWMKKLSMSRAKVYLTGENLLTWSPIFKHTKMFDPEVISTGDSDFDGGTQSGLSGVGDGYSYPMLKSFTLGIDLTF